MDMDKQNPASNQVPPEAPQSSAHDTMPPNRPPEAPVYTPPAQPPRRRSVVTPLILIILGVSFLLSNLGLVSLNIWELMFRLWPLWLVAAGIDLLIGRRSRWGAWIAAGLVLALIGGAGFFVQGSWAIAGESARAEAFTQPLDTAAHRAEITIHGSVGQLTVREAGSASILAEGQVSPVPGERVTHDYYLNGDTARYTLDSRRQNFVPFFGASNGGRWDVALNPQIPLSLNLSTGVGKAEIDLSHLQVTDLRLQSGVGETNVTLPAQGQLRARIDSGVGAITIRLPKGLAARITADNGIGSVNVPAGYSRQGDAWVVAGYDSAQNRVELNVHGGVGAINIEQAN